MEVPFIREEEVVVVEEENGVNLETRRKSKSHHQNISNLSFTSSDTSVITTELSNSSSVEYSSVSSMENYYHNNISNGNNTNYTITNGEKPNFIEGRSVKNEEEEEEALESLSQADEKASFDESNKRENYGNVAHQNHDSNGTAARQKGVDVGFKDVGSMLDGSSNGVNVVPPEIYNVNKFVILDDQGEIVENGHSEEIEQEFGEYQVESVVKNQKTHDIICPNCRECITNRVILKRRKRKAPEPDHKGESSQPIDEPPQVEPTSGRLDAISCLSCFSIFIPKGNRFLWWSFDPKQPGALESGVTTSEQTSPVELSRKDGTGKCLPLWFLTCCQPDHTEKPVPKHDREPPLAPEQSEAGGAEGQGPPKSKLPTVTDPGSNVPAHDLKPPSSTSDDTPVDPTQTPTIPEPGPAGTPFATKPVTSIVNGDGSKVSADVITPPSPTPGDTPDNSTQTPAITEADTPFVTKQRTPINNDGGNAGPTSEQKSPPKQSEDASTSVQSDQKPLVHPDGGFPLWFLSCCQPSTDKINTKSPEKSGEHAIKIPEDPSPPPSVTTTNQSEAEVVSGTENTVVQHPREDRRPGISGPDIIKAIVYGGLVECITSLSVITSAAGGDATTLNIVALGLANVAGGLVLLLHNLRVLLHEHTEDRYENQLGRRDRFWLHAVVAVISYLVFGLLSPVIYGFTFRKSDNKDYKLAALAAAALVCITVLSIGKAYVRRLSNKAYLQTILYYISVGFMVSGVGYVAGDLINMLLKKLGVFDSSAAPVAVPRLEAGFVDGAWSSY